jgi:hypothetical protein
LDTNLVDANGSLIVPELGYYPDIRPLKLCSLETILDGLTDIILVAIDIRAFQMSVSSLESSRDSG